MLEINNLSIHYKNKISKNNPLIKAVDDISFVINPGEILGIAGESGSGKSQTALAIMRLLPQNAIIQGSIRFLNQEITGLSLEQINKIRGNQICMIFQDPMTALNPYLTIASQMTEVLMLHQGTSYSESFKTAINLLDLTRIPEAKNRIHQYPHEFSGGMRQRIMIAMGLLCHPKLLIADEPTTALDVTTQAKILKILKDLQHEFNMAILIITHDMGVMANIAERVQVFYEGKLVESGSVETIFYSPQHSHTKALLEAVRFDHPKSSAKKNIEKSLKLLTINNLSIHFPLKKHWFNPPQILYAVDDISFDVYSGETLGIVGESGCGKSTLARAILGLNTITHGDIIFDEKISLPHLSTQQWHPLRQHIQLIFQDPVASLNPRMTVLELIAEPLKIYHPELSQAAIHEEVSKIMKAVDLTDEQMYRYPQEFSGGQCQRINIARALILKPKLLVCDEATSALDATTKLHIIQLLQKLKKQFNLTLVFISHDLSLLKHLSDRIIVMYLGHIMEVSDNPENLYAHPHHPYTQALLSAISVPDPRIEHQKTLKLGSLEI